MEKTIIQQNGVNVYVEINNGTINVNTKREIPLDLVGLPFLSSENLIERIDELNDFKNKLHKNKIIQINGIGGIGKSIFGKNFLHKNRDYFNHALWLTCQTNIHEALIYNNQLIDSLVLKEEIDSIPQNNNYNKSVYDLIVNRLRLLKASKDKLNILFFDNINDDDAIRNLDALSLHPNWIVVLISRIKIIEIKSFKLPPLSEENCISLFKNHYRKPVSNEYIIEIAKIIDCHTLTIELISKTLNNCRTISLSEYIENLNSVGINLERIVKIKTTYDKVDIMTHIDECLKTTFRITEFLFTDFHKEILTYLSILPTIDYSFEKLKETLQIEEANLEIFEEALNLFVLNGWLNEVNDLFRVHSVVQNVLRITLMPNYEKCEKILESFNYLKYGNFEHGIMPRESVLTITSEISSFVKFIKDSKFFLHSAYKILSSLNSILLNYESAIIYGLKDIEICKELYGEFDIITATSYSNCSIVLSKVGKHEEALNYELRAIEIKENPKSNQGKTIPEVNFHTFYSTETNISEDKNSVKDNLKIAKIRLLETTSTNSATNLAASYCNMAETLRTKRMFAEALKYSFKAIDLDEKIYKQTGFATKALELAYSYNNHALLLADIGLFADAQELQKEVIKIREKYFYDANHFLLVPTYRNYAVFSLHLNHLDDALKYSIKSVEVADKVLLEKDIELLISYELLSFMFNKISDIEKSISCYTRTIYLYEKHKHHLNNPHNYAHACYTVGANYNSIGNCIEADKFVSHALNWFKQIYDDENPNLIEAIKLQNDIRKKIKDA